MKLLYVADGRSPTAAGWIGYFIEQGHEVHLVSTYPAEALQGLASFHVITTTAGRLAASSGETPGGRLRRFAGPGLGTAFRRLIDSGTLSSRSIRLRAQIQAVDPDLVHALRIPFEGMLAASAMAGRHSPAMRKTPLVLSVWGNDFTLHAKAGPRMAALTRTALHRANALIADCRRDIRLSHEWGFPDDLPTTVLPGGGGVRSQFFHAANTVPGIPLRIVQPRGLRAYVENEAFLRAIPTILSQYPEVRFACPGLAESRTLAALSEQLGIDHAVDLLPPVSQIELAAIFRRSAIVVSPTTHDGTPNSLLEALACGCFPVAGDLEPVREWITHGQNGLLVNAASPPAIAAGILTAIQDPGLRIRARDQNIRMVSERAAYGKVMPQALDFYRELV